jgi:fatty acid desaturase
MRMKRPTWATVISVLGIILSLLGLLGAGQDIMMPKMMEFQKQMFTQMEEIQHCFADCRRCGR